MTDYELHREEWIAERAGMLMCNGMSREQADAVALQMWLQLDYGAVSDFMRGCKTAQEATNDLD